MNPNQKAAQSPTLGEQDELCRNAGWPTITEQRKHWQEQDETLLAAFEAVRNTIKNLTDAVSGLRDICKLQQEQIDKLKVRDSMQ